MVRVAYRVRPYPKHRLVEAGKLGQYRRDGPGREACTSAEILLVSRRGFGQDMALRAGLFIFSEFHGYRGGGGQGDGTLPMRTLASRAAKATRSSSPPWFRPRRRCRVRWSSTWSWSRA